MCIAKCLLREISKHKDGIVFLIVRCHGMQMLIYSYRNVMDTVKM